MKISIGMLLWVVACGGGTSEDSGTPTTGSDESTVDTQDSGADEPSTSTWGTGPFADYCHVQWPCSTNAEAGAETEAVYVWVYHGGTTDAVGQGPGIRVEVGHGADGSTPPDASWNWFEAAYNEDKDGLYPSDVSNDEYQGTMTAPTASGAYDFAARVSIDAGATWMACDLGGESCPGVGSDDGYDSGSAGELVVP